MARPDGRHCAVLACEADYSKIQHFSKLVEENIEVTRLLDVASDKTARDATENWHMLLFKSFGVQEGMEARTGVTAG